LKIEVKVLKVRSEAMCLIVGGEFSRIYLAQFGIIFSFGKLSTYQSFMEV
jgi:hypothetical protein